MFASKYLTKNNNVPFIEGAPSADLGIIVVIPCLREPAILEVLQKLANCQVPVCHCEVIVLVNHSEVADENTRQMNAQTAGEIAAWIANQNQPKLKYHCVGPVALRKKWAGAGLARKHGMDEALRRFSMLDKKDGLIVSLDADTLVDENYLVALEQHFFQKKKQVGATIAFSHRTEDVPEKQKEGIELYELYLKYYKEALEYSGYPHALFTIGSAFAVKAEAYMKRGGMNRRQAGEDFYFLQNLVQMGEVGQIESTQVHPSARLSDRVPFGTGPILQKWMNGEEDLTQTYNFSAFADLKQMFDKVDELYQIQEGDYLNLLNAFSVSLKEFLISDKFWNELSDLNKNCANPKSFGQRFYQKFNAFKILKYLNFAHENYYDKANLYKQNQRLNKEKQA